MSTERRLLVQVWLVCNGLSELLLHRSIEKAVTSLPAALCVATQGRQSQYEVDLLLDTRAITMVVTGQLDPASHQRSTAELHPLRIS
jgi:hypothetical protein